MKKRNDAAWTGLGVGVAGVALLLAAACRPITTVTARIDIPAVAAVKLEGIEEIVIADFLVDPPVKEFSVGPALVDYFSDEMKKEFKGRISAVPFPWTDVAQADDKDAWTRLLADPKDKLILTGRARYAQDVRKALSAKDRRAIDEGPFGPEKAWAERKNFDLKLDIFLIRPDTGEAVLKKDFQESLIVENRKQTAEFAFYDLLQRVRPKLFRLLFGSVRSQERYLLSR
jgi:hypothetical protein